MDKIQLGQEAKRESEVLRVAFERIEADLIREWSESKLEQKDEREVLYLRLCAARAVRDKLKSFVNSALIAQANQKA